MLKLLTAAWCLVFIASIDAAAAQRRAPANVPAPATNSTGHQAGRLLFENDQFALYESTGFDSWCTNRQASVTQIFKVGPDFRIEDDAAYHQRFERYVLPAVLQGCQAPRVFVQHFIQGIRFDGRMNEYGPNDALPGREIGLSRMMVYLNGRQIDRYSHGIDYVSVSDLRQRREAGAKAAERSAVVAAAAQKAQDEKARQLAGATHSSDGKLKVAGAEPATKDIFLQIYEGRFVELSRLDRDDYVPYLMFSGVIQGYDDLCGSALSSTAASVDIYATKFVGSTYAPFVQTNYYQKYLVGTVRMERKYEAAYRASVATFLSKAVGYYKRNRGEDVFGFYLDLSKRGIALALANRKLMTDNGCRNPATLRYIDNLHRFVTDQWSSSTVSGGYQYFDEARSWGTKRSYAKVPRTFSPEFPAPAGDKRWEIIVNEGHEYDGLRWLEIEPLNHHPWMFKKAQAPAPVVAAMGENKYQIVRCSYRHQGYGPDLTFWNANGPVPSPEVQEAARPIIGAPRTTCPVTYAGN